MPWYRTGTVSATQNSSTVIGAGTAFITACRVGEGFIGPDGVLYEVINIASDTALAISPPYKGASTTAGDFTIAPMQGYLKDTADALRKASLEVGGALDGLDDSVQQAATSAATAVAAKNAAGASETNAAQSAMSADAAQDAAELAASQAEASASASLESKNAASAAEVSASESASQALASKQAAYQSETNAAASAAAAGNSGVGRGFIEGLGMRWRSTTSIQVDPGSCWINGLGKVYKVPVALTVTPPTGTTGFCHIYVYDNAGTPAAECVTVDAEAYWNSAKQKTGDSSRRYIGSVLINSSIGAYKFRHLPELSKVMYMAATPAATPFLLLGGGSATSFTPVSAASVAPSSALELIVVAVPTSQDAVFSTEDAQNSAAVSNWMQAARAGSQTPLTLAFSMANTLRRFTYLVDSGGNLTIYATGYTFGR
jgi:hypothetical protein